MTTYKKGQQVKHPNRPDWGIGEIVNEPVDGKLRIDFEKAGLRVIREADVFFEVLAERHPRNVRVINLEKVFKLCDLFYAEMKDNRKGKDDGGVALKIKEEFQRRGEPTESTRRQLLAWCHTNGSVFQRGVDLARQIYTEIYGHVPPRLEQAR
jgi:hypothetical protein